MAERDEQETFCLMVSESFIGPALFTFAPRLTEGQDFHHPLFHSC